MSESIVAIAKNYPGQLDVVILGGGYIEHDVGVHEHLLSSIRQLNIRMCRWDVSQ